MRVSKDGIRPAKVRRNKSSDKRMVAIFPMKSGASISAHQYVDDRLFQVFNLTLQRPDKTGLFGLILHDDDAHDFIELE